MGNPVTLAEVDGYVAKWAPRLHLQDWIISTAVEDLNGAAGTSQSHYLLHTTHLKIDEGMPTCLKKRGGPWIGRETEAVVIHELLHVWGSPLHDDFEGDVNEKVTALQERMIDQMVRVLLEADAAGAWTA